MPQLAHKYPNARVTASSAQRAWPGLFAERLEHPAGTIHPFETVRTELTVVLEGSGSVSRQLDGARPQTIAAEPGAMWLTPEGVREDFIDFESPIPQALHLYLAPDRFGFVCPDTQQRSTAISALRRDAPFRDPLLEEIARAVGAELQAPTDGSYSLIAPLGLCLAARLVHAHLDASSAPIPPRHASRLDTRRLAEVREHVAAHLEHPVRVAELAGVAFLSPSRFAHAFKISTGESPQQYVRARRIDRAKVLLCDGILPLAEVADTCGFASQASFTRAFARAIGESPGRYRQQFEQRRSAVGIRENPLGRP
jgi:AraC family transcriptional regulator